MAEFTPSQFDVGPGASIKDYDALRKRSRTKFEELMDQYHQGLVDEPPAAEPATAQTAIAPDVFTPAIGGTVPDTNPAQMERSVSQLPATDTRLRTTDAGGKPLRGPASLWENPAFLKSSYEGKREMLAANQQALRDAWKAAGMDPKQRAALDAILTTELGNAQPAAPTYAGLRDDGPDAPKRRLGSVVGFARDLNNKAEAAFRDALAATLTGLGLRFTDSSLLRDAVKNTAQIEEDMSPAMADIQKRQHELIDKAVANGDSRALQEIRNLANSWGGAAGTAASVAGSLLPIALTRGGAPAIGVQQGAQGAGQFRIELYRAVNRMTPEQLLAKPETKAEFDRWQQQTKGTFEQYRDLKAQGLADNPDALLGSAGIGAINGVLMALGPLGSGAGRSALKYLGEKIANDYFKKALTAPVTGVVGEAAIQAGGAAAQQGATNVLSEAQQQTLDPKAKVEGGLGAAAGTAAAVSLGARAAQAAGRRLGAKPAEQPAPKPADEPAPDNQTNVRLNGLVEDPDIPGTFYHPDGTIATDAEVAALRPTPAPSGMENTGFNWDGVTRPTSPGELPVAQTTRPVTSFATAKGSTYEVSGNTTTRNKAARSDPGHEGDFGPKETSQHTYYVDDNGLQALSLMAAQGAPARQIAPLGDGRIGVRYTAGKDAGQFEGRTVVQPREGPAVGLYPVEIWGDGSEFHFGNRITSVKTAIPEQTLPAGVRIATEEPAAPRVGRLTEGPLEQVETTKPTEPGETYTQLGDLVVSSKELAALAPEVRARIDDLIVERGQLEAKLADLEGFPKATQSRQFLQDRLRMLDSEVGVTLRPQAEGGEGGALPGYPLSSLVETTNARVRASRERLGAAQEAAAREADAVTQELSGGKRLGGKKKEVSDDAGLTDVTEGTLPSAREGEVPARPGVDRPENVAGQETSVAPRMGGDDRVTSGAGDTQGAGSSGSAKGNTRTRRLARADTATDAERSAAQTDGGNAPDYGRRPGNNTLAEAVGEAINTDTAGKIDPYGRAPKSERPQREIAKAIGPDGSDFSGVLRVVANLPDATPAQVALARRLDQLTLGTEVRQAPRGLSAADIEAGVVHIGTPSIGDVLHEGTHIATAPAIDAAYQQYVAGKNTTEAKAYQSLVELSTIAREQLGEYYGANPGVAVDPKFTPLLRVNELVAEMHSNPAFAQAATRIRVGEQTLMQRFVNAIRELFGLEPKYNNLMAEVLKNSDVFFRGPLFDPEGTPLTSFAKWQNTPLAKAVADATETFSRGQLGKRKEESLLDSVRRNITNTLRPVQRAEEGFQVHRQWDEKELFRTTSRAAAEAELKRLRATGTDAYIKTGVTGISDEHSMFHMLTRSAGQLESMSKVMSEKFVKPLEPKIQDFVDKHAGGDYAEGLRRLDEMATAVGTRQRNKVGKLYRTPLTDEGEALRAKVRDDVVAGLMAPAAMDKAVAQIVKEHNTGKLTLGFGGATDAQVAAKIKGDPQAYAALQAMAPELSALRRNILERNADAGMIDRRVIRQLEGWDPQGEYFPLFDSRLDRVSLSEYGVKHPSVDQYILEGAEGRSSWASNALSNLIVEAHRAEANVLNRDILSKWNDGVWKAQAKTAGGGVADPDYLNRLGLQRVSTRKIDALGGSAQDRVASAAGPEAIVVRKRLRDAGGNLYGPVTEITYGPRPDKRAEGLAFIDAVRGGSPSELSALSKVLSPMTKLYSQMQTRFNWDFGPTNYIRDARTIGQFMLADYGPAAMADFGAHLAKSNPVALFRAIEEGKLFKGNTDTARDMNRLEALGGLVSYKKGINIDTVDPAVLRGRSGLARRAIETIDRVNQAFEFSTRLAAFRTLRDRGVPEATAAQWALETANFGARGKQTQQWAAKIPFFNPQMQGIARYARLIRQAADGSRSAQAAVLGGVLVTSAAYMLQNAIAGKDDEGRDVLAKVNPATLYRNDVFLDEKGKGIKVARSLDFSPTDGLGVAAARVFAGHATPKEAMAEWAKNGLGKLSPVEPADYDSFFLGLVRAMVGAFGPVIDIGTNQNIFGGKLSKEQQGTRVTPHAAYDGRDTTAQPFKDFAAMMADAGIGKKMAPEYYRHLLEQYGGGVGRTVSTWMAYADANQPEREYARLWPVLGGFVQPPSQGVPRYNKAYEAAKEVARDLASYTGDRRERYLADNPKAQQIADLYASTEKELQAAARTTNKSALGQKEKTTVTQTDRARIQQAFLDRYQELTR
mgnify:FL=1